MNVNEGWVEPSPMYDHAPYTESWLVSSLRCGLTRTQYEPLRAGRSEARAVWLCGTGSAPELCPSPSGVQAVVTVSTSQVFVAQSQAPEAYGDTCTS